MDNKSCKVAKSSRNEPKYICKYCVPIQTIKIIARGKKGDKYLECRSSAKSGITLDVVSIHTGGT